MYRRRRRVHRRLRTLPSTPPGYQPLSPRSGSVSDDQQRLVLLLPGRQHHLRFLQHRFLPSGHRLPGPGICYYVYCMVERKRVRLIVDGGASSISQPCGKHFMTTTRVFFRISNMGGKPTLRGPLPFTSSPPVSLPSPLPSLPFPSFRSRLS